MDGRRGRLVLGMGLLGWPSTSLVVEVVETDSAFVYYSMP
jgi:hypothetical protein